MTIESNVLDFRNHIDLKSQTSDSGGQISNLLIELDSIHQHNLIHADSLLTEVGRDSCDIVTDWQIVYDALIDEKSGEEVNQRQIADLEQIALKCPTHVGHVIYSARRIVSDRTHLRYDLIDDCGRGRVDTRSKVEKSMPTTQLSLVPNPATTQVTISLPKGSDGQLTITALSGLEVYHSVVDAKQEIIVDTSQLRSGVYVVSFLSVDGKVYTTKLVQVD